MSLVRSDLIHTPLEIDPRTLAQRIATLAWPAILESGPGFPQDGRWSIYAAEPVARFLSPDGFRSWIEPLSPTLDLGSFTALPRPADPHALDALARWMERLGLDVHGEPPAGDEPPFRGGLIGCLSYDLAPAIERLPRRSPHVAPFPTIQLHLYDTFATHDRLTGRTALWSARFGQLSSRRSRQKLQRWKERLTSLQLSPDRHARLAPASPSHLLSNFTPEDYFQAVARALDYIRAGDIFQVNLSQRFHAPAQCDGLDLYLALRDRSPAPFAAFLDLGDGAQVVSSSPEWFYQTRGSRIVTRPIKGTRPRGHSLSEDLRHKHDLAHSAKDRAELTMIIDLERNDLGRVCEYGSIRVIDPFAIESFTNVHHLVATIAGALRPEVTAVDVIRAVFPGGSITGAPKIRAMQIIDELERGRRSLYTGAIGYWSPGASATNIAIRTLLVEPRGVSYQVGGGIVADSDPQAEYDETLAKGRLMREVLSDRISLP